MILNYRVNAELFPVIRDSVCTNVLIFCVFEADSECMLSFSSEEVRKKLSAFYFFYFISFYFLCGK